MSKLLIQEKPIMLLPGLATALGINEAIFLQQLHYWLLLSEEFGYGVVHDNKRWVYKKTEEWVSCDFPFWSTRTLDRIIKKLDEGGYLLRAQLSPDKWVRTNYYTIDYKKLDTLKLPETPSPKPLTSDSKPIKNNGLTDFGTLRQRVGMDSDIVANSKASRWRNVPETPSEISTNRFKTRGGGNQNKKQNQSDVVDFIERASLSADKEKQFNNEVMVDECFKFFHSVWPRKFSSIWSNPEEVNKSKAVWVSAFAQCDFLNSETLSKGLFKIKFEKWPPDNPAQFLSFCHIEPTDISAPCMNDAFAEVVQNSYRFVRPWSHKCVYAASTKLSHKLLSQDTERARREFEVQYQSALDNHALIAEGLPLPVKDFGSKVQVGVSLDRQAGIEAIAQMRKKLKGFD